VCHQAVTGLEIVDTPRSTEGLIHALDSSQKAVRERSVKALAERAADEDSPSRERAIEGLIHALDNSEYKVRREAILALHGIDTARAREGVKKALNNSDERIRRLAREAMKN